MHTVILLLALCALLLLQQLLPVTARLPDSPPRTHPTLLLEDDVATAPASDAPGDPLVVTTDCGPALGSWITVASHTDSSSGNSSAAPSSASSSRVAVWRSFRYAAPPVRWSAPKKPSCWKGVYNATTFRDICAQQVGDAVVGSEDCLYLHVYAPEEIAVKNAERQQRQQRHQQQRGQRRHRVELQSARSQTTRGGRRSLLARHTTEHERGAPILVYIHGGSLASGSGNLEPLAPFVAHARSAASGEAVIAVAINYRLNMFGFLALKELSDVAGPNEPAANFGILDQQAALRWVQRNARAFGGDPTRVTLMGQSSGGTSIFAHYASEGSRDLFAGAIALSGSINISMTLAEGQAQNADIVSAIGCHGGLANASSASVVSCLRSASVEALVKAVPLSWGTPGIWGLDGLVPSGRHFAGMLLVDGKTITTDFGSALASGLVDKPLIVGNCGQEGDVSPDLDFSDWSLDRFAAYLTNALAAWKEPLIAPAILKAYERMDNGSLADAEYIFAAFNADYGVTCGTVQLLLDAKRASGDARFKSPLYSFVSQWSPSVPQLFGLHLARYAFHTTDYNAAIENYAMDLPSDQDRAQTALLQRVWSTFMSEHSLSSLEKEIGWKQFDDHPDFPLHWNTFVQRPHDASRNEVDYKAGQCILLAEYGFGQGFWWVN